MATYSDDPQIKGLLTDLAGNTLREKSLFLILNGVGGSYVKSGITDLTSEVSLEALPLPAGEYTLDGYFAGTIPLPGGTLELLDTNYEASTVSQSVELLPENSLVTYTGDLEILIGGPLNLAAVVIQEDDGEPGDITLAKVEFQLFDDAGERVTTILADVGMDRVAAGTINGLPSGTYSIQLAVVGGFYASAVSDPVSIEVGLSNNGSPDCTAASANRESLWPPNHRLVAIDVQGVTDPEGGHTDITIDYILQDEPPSGNGSGSTEVDGTGVGSARGEVRAERSGNGNGRVYHIGFTATDTAGLSCSGEVQVGVPVGKKGTAVDDGPLYDSTGGASGTTLMGSPPSDCGVTCIYLPIVR